MGKPSIKSRKTTKIRKKNRKNYLKRNLNSKEEEIADLQIQMNDFKKDVKDAGEKLLDEINKCSRENNNAVEWLKIYDKQINNYEEQLYNLNVKLYFSSTSQQPPPPQSQQSHQPQQSPTYKSMDDYFRSQD